MTTPAPTQYVGLARREGWRTEPRDRRGRWSKAAADAQELTESDRAKGNASLERFRPLRFPSDADASDYLRRSAPRLPAAQRDAVTRYSGDAFYRLNRALRAGDAGDPEVRRLDAAVRPSPEDMIVTRHVDHIADPGALAGKKLTDKAFASASLGSPYAGGLGGVTLHIAVPKGTPVINAAGVSSNAHEREVILGRGTSIAISRVVPNGRYGHDAYGVIIPPAPDSVDLAQAAPVPPPQQPAQAQQPPPQQQGDGLDDTALAVAIAALLAQLTVTAAYGTSVAVLLAALRARFKLSASAWSAMGDVLSMVVKHPATVSGVTGPASRQVSSMNAARRAQYVTAATRRVLATEREARARGLSVDAAREQALATEQRYYEMHMAAMKNRAAAAGETDKAAAKYGKLLGWNAILDSRTSPECRAADGKNYYASAMPDIGFPGATHLSCRCTPGPAHPGAKLLPSSGLRFARAA